MEQDLSKIELAIKKLNSKICCVKDDLDSQEPVTLSYNGETGELTFTDQYGTETIINMPLEMFLAQAAYDPDTNILTLTMADDTTFNVDLSDLVDVATVPGGLDTQIQYNNAGVFGGSSQLIANIGATNTLDIQGSGSTSATNALRVRNSSGTNAFSVNNQSSISINTTFNAGMIDVKQGFSPDLIRGYNSSDALVHEFYVGGGHGEYYLRNSSSTTRVLLTSNGTSEFSYPTGASKPTLLLSGTGYSGGTATTTKPTLLIEPTGTTSTGWSTSGTKLGVNAESGFTGMLLDLQVNGSSFMSVLGSGTIIRNNASAFRNNTINCSLYFDAGILVIRDGNSSDTNVKISFGSLTGTAHPMLKRNGTGLDIRLADDSGYGLFNTGKTTIYGSGATSATSSLIVQNSSASEILKISDDGKTVINTLTIGLGNNQIVSNMAIGYQSLNSITSGTFNHGIGYQTLKNTTTATKNTAVGYFASTLVTGSNNTSLGYKALGNSTSSTTNTAIGVEALQASNSGGENTALGYQALYSNISGWGNVALGNQAAYSNNSGFGSVSIGYQARYSSTSGNYNVGIGYATYNSSSTGSDNIAIGKSALANSGSAQGNVVLGTETMITNSSGSYNVAIGKEAGGISGNPLANSSGSQNIFIGYQTLGELATESNRTFIGNTSTTSTWLGGSLLIGTRTPVTNAQAVVTSTSKGFLPPRLTTAERDAVTWVTGDGGMIIFNRDTLKHQGYDGTTWNDLY